MKCRATQVGADTALSKIIDMVSDAAATKAPIAKLADKVSGVQGTIGIIGPKRMDYENVVDNLKTLKVQLDNIFKKP